MNDHDTNYDANHDTNDAEHDEARDALARYFRSSIDGAPPVPEKLRALGAREVRTDPGVRGLLRIPALASAAAIMLLAVGLALVPQREVDASPAAVLQRASDRFLELEDALLRLSIVSDALSFLVSLSDQHDDSRPAFEPEFWVLVQQPNRFLMWGEETGSTVETSLQTSGFDGATAWTYLEKENVVELQTVEPGEGVAAMNLTEYLSFGFIRELQAQEKYDIEETTGPADRRAGRRTFRLEQLDENGAPDRGEGPIFEEATITVDERTDLIEKYQVDMRLGPFSLFGFRLELAEVNRGIDSRRFRFDRHVPDGVTVRHVDSADPKGFDLKLSTSVKEGPKSGEKSGEK